MNKILFFIISSICVFVSSIIVLCLSPIINNTYINTYNWKFSDWRTVNCQIIKDLRNSEKINLDDFNHFSRIKNLCIREKSMYDLEYATLIINLFLGFLCSNLSLFQYLDIGIKIPRKIGLLGIIFGFCGFVLTIIYISFNGYIFTNDVAYNGRITKLFPNGAKYKFLGDEYITAYEEDINDDAEYIKYKELRDKQYNYNSEYFKFYMKSPNDCKKEYLPNPFDKNKYIPGCDYIFSKPITNIENRNLYDKWVTSLIFEVFILIGDLSIFILGLLILIYEKSDMGDDTIDR